MKKFKNEVQKLIKEQRYYEALEMIRMDSHADYILYKRFTEANILLRIDAPEEARKAYQKFYELTAHNVSDEELSDQGFTAEQISCTMASIDKELWKKTKSRVYAQEGYVIFKSVFDKYKSSWAGINAVIMGTICGEENVCTLLEPIKDLCTYSLENSETSFFWNNVTLAECCLFQENVEKACEHYKKILLLHPDGHYTTTSKFPPLKTVLNNLNLIYTHCLNKPVPQIITDLLTPPPHLVFCGHMIDSPKRVTPRFPANDILEKAIKSRIDAYIEETGARIGYCSGANGSDILFAESMLEKGCSIKLFLPFNKSEFKNASVSVAGRDWVSRFDAICRNKNVEITYTDKGKYLGHDQMFRYVNRVKTGKAMLDGENTSAQVKLLAVVDKYSINHIGGTLEQCERWKDKDNLKIIDLNELQKEYDREPEQTMRTNEERKLPGVLPVQREIKSMLFADIKGFGSLEDDKMPFFVYTFLNKVVSHLNDQGEFQRPLMVNTWGDGIFMVMNDPVSLACYALALVDVIHDTDWSMTGLGSPEIRIGLHCGPIYKVLNPITLREDFFGNHVNLSARLEPKAVPGQIYASEHFAAILKEELSQCEDIQICRKIRTAFIGKVNLPKDFGIYNLYRIFKSRSKLGQDS